MKYLLCDANIVLEGKRQDIAVVEGRLDLNPSLSIEAYDQVLNLEGRLLIRGFWDLHTHLDKALVSRTLENKSGTLNEAISIMTSYKAQMTDEDIVQRALSTLELCYKHGTRYVRSHVDVDTTIGIRSVLALQEAKRRFGEGIQLEIVAFPQEGLVGKPGNVQVLDDALAAGADLVGGIPANDSDPVAHMSLIFDLAEKHNVAIDMHIDETDDPAVRTLELLADMVIQRDWKGKVFAGHCCSLASIPPEEAKVILEKLRSAGIRVISLPSTNLYLEGRGDTYKIRRGIAPIKPMTQEYDIPVALASDNIQDPFNPFGCGSLLQLALIAAHGCHMGGTKDIESLFRMITQVPMNMCDISEKLSPGEVADFLVLDAKTIQEAIINQAPVYARAWKDSIEV